MGKLLFIKKVNKINRKESAFSHHKSLIIFELTDYVGNPNFMRVEDTFSFITKSCIG